MYERQDSWLLNCDFTAAYFPMYPFFRYIFIELLLIAGTRFWHYKGEEESCGPPGALLGMGPFHVLCLIKLATLQLVA